PSESGGLRHVVERAVPLDLPEEPEPLLGERERRRALHRAALDPAGPLRRGSARVAQPLEERALPEREREVAGFAAHGAASPRRRSTSSSDSAAMGATHRAVSSTAARSPAEVVKASANAAGVGDSKIVRTGSSISKISRTRERTCVAVREWPPSSKKSSSTPTRDTLRTSPQIPAITSSVGVRGARKGASTPDRSSSAAG